MSLSSVCVVTNALRLRYFKNKNLMEEDVKMEQEICCENGCCSIKKHKEEKIVKTISIEGMQCNHCKMTVEKVLGAIDGVTKVDVSLENKNAVIESNKEIANDTIKKVIEEAGFEVKNICD